jgi:hypothetical protein
MEQEILIELKELRAVITKLVGTSHKPESEKFSKEAIVKAAREFQELSIKRGEWISENDLGKIFKDAPYGAGKFIRESFKFSNYFTKRKTYYYNKKDLQELKNELKERKVDLARFIEYLNEEQKFKTNIEQARQNRKGKRFPYDLPASAHDIETSAAKPPAREIIRTDIKRLKFEFMRQGLDDYIDVYHDRFAMMKHIYFFDRYLEPGIKSRCVKWIKDFNYAKEALEHVKMTEKERSSGASGKELASK